MIVITDVMWDRYLNKLRSINSEAARKMFSYLAHNDWYLNDAARQLAIDVAYAIATEYGEAATAAACEMYDEIMEASMGAVVQPAVPAPTATYGEVAAAFNGAAKNGSAEMIANAVSRLTKLAGEDTTLQNAIRDEAEFAWIPHGDTCAYCIALASRGWQTASADVMAGNHADHVHANCDCTFAVKKGDGVKYAGYNPNKYKRIYDNASGRTSRQKINSIARGIYADNKDEINARKRAEYAARKEREE